MSEEPRTPVAGWTRSWEFPRIFRAARMAFDPSKLVLALVALVLTWAWAGLLDVAWKSSGRGVTASALQGFRDGAPAAVTSAKGDVGVGALWRDAALQAVREAGTAAVSFNWMGPGSFVDCIGDICGATRWLVARHYWYALFFLLGGLAIWSILGGAICRIAAVEYARDEKVTLRDALRFTQEKFVSGFLLAPLLPLVIIGVIALFMAIGGFLLSIPAVGNLAGLLFPLALVGGALIAFLLVGSAGGGSLFWPTVAVEGSDSFDAISRSLSYFFGKPVKALFYGLVAAFWGSICWVVLHFGVWLSLRAAHACLDAGTGLFGWGRRPDAGEGLSKLDVLWPVPQMGDLVRFGDRDHMGGWEIVPAAWMVLWAVLAVGVLWAFLAAFYFSSSTIIYYILRHDVDATDYDDVYVEDDAHEPPARTAAPTQPAGAGVSLPVMNAPAPKPPTMESSDAEGAPSAGGQ